MMIKDLPWNLSMIQADKAWARGLTGKQIKVAVLDTGVQELEGLSVLAKASFVPNEKREEEVLLHGTCCAQIITSIAPEVALYDVKALACNTDSGLFSGDISWIIKGMDWCVEQGIQVISMSIGLPEAPLDDFAQAVKRCQEAGTTVIVSAGNTYNSPFPWVCAPANSFILGDSLASPIAVGAVNAQSILAFSSSRGANGLHWNPVSVVAPGMQIPLQGLESKQVKFGGTSAASAHVAGLAALLCQRFPDIKPQELKERIIETASMSKHPDVKHGYGLINCDLATL